MTTLSDRNVAPIARQVDSAAVKTAHQPSSLAGESWHGQNKWLAKWIGGGSRKHDRQKRQRLRAEGLLPPVDAHGRVHCELPPETEAEQLEFINKYVAAGDEFSEWITEARFHAVHGYWRNDGPPSRPSMKEIPIWRAKWLTKQSKTSTYQKWREKRNNNISRIAAFQHAYAVDNAKRHAAEMDRVTANNAAKEAKRAVAEISYETDAPALSAETLQALHLARKERDRERTEREHCKTNHLTLADIMAGRKKGRAA